MKVMQRILLVWLLGSLFIAMWLVIANYDLIGISIMGGSLIGIFGTIIALAIKQERSGNEFRKTLKVGDVGWFSGRDRSFDGKVVSFNGEKIVVEVEIYKGQLYPKSE